MLGVKRTRCFDDRGRRPIGRERPRAEVDRWTGDGGEAEVDDRAERSCARLARVIHAIRICVQAGGSRAVVFRRDQDREDGRGVARLMEVLQIERVIPDLLAGGPFEGG